MSEADFQLLCLYYSVEPWGGVADQLNAGIVAATVANCRQGRRRGDKSMMPCDFMPSHQRSEKLRRRNQTPEEILGIFRHLVKMQTPDEANKDGQLK